MKSGVVPSEQQGFENFASPLLTCLQKHYLSEDTAGRRKPSVEIGSSDLHFTMPSEIAGGFVVAISLHDAITLFVSTGITKNLGYQQDMLIGQSLLGYLYPRDRLTFVSFLSQGLQARFNTNESVDNLVLSFYVRMREYRESGGLDKIGAKCTCKPFQLNCSIRTISLDQQQQQQQQSMPGSLETTLVQTICFIIVAIPLITAHKLPRERNPVMVPFTTRHTTSCHFSHVDTVGLPFLGYFPQDMIGFPIFDFYHQDDLALIREVYDLILIHEGSFCSKPYRFKIFNGDFIILETEWSCFINPWSKKFEFIVGQHRIVQGPLIVDAFLETENTNKQTNDSELMKRTQEEISTLLSQPVQRAVHRKDLHPKKGFKRKRAQDAVAAGTEGKAGRNEGQALHSDDDWSDKESVLLGVISPHREDSEDLQDQRLQDNIDRFFASQPKTISPSSSTGSSNQSPDGSGSNDGSGSSSCINNKSSNDSAFQSGSCGDGATREKTADKSIPNVSQAQSKEHANQHFGEILTEDLLAQHDRVCQRQMRKGQFLHPKPSQGKDESAGMKTEKTGKNQHKNKKRLNSDKNVFMTLDEMFRNPSFPLQSALTLGFAPFFLGSNSCPSCASLTKQMQQHTQQQQENQSFYLPLMCTVPITLCPAGGQSNNKSASRQSSNKSCNKKSKNASKGGRTRALLQKNESSSPVRHVSHHSFQEDDRKLPSTKCTQEIIHESADSGRKVSTTGESFASTSFDSSSGGEDSGGGGSLAANDQNMDQILMMETAVKTEVPAPWISMLPNYSDDVVFQYRMRESSSSPQSDVIRDQPDLVRKQYNLLRSEKRINIRPEDYSDNGSDFREADLRDFMDMIGEEL